MLTPHNHNRSQTPSQKKIALITGANRGIGLEICRQLAQRGLEVILTARNTSRGLEAQRQLQNEGLQAAFCHLDVAQEASIQKAAEKISNEYNKLDILINNAAILHEEDRSILDVKRTVVEETLAVNFFGPLRVIQMFLPLLEKSPQGRIINISSGMGAFSEMGGGYGAYRISKTALNALTLIFANELRHTSITINAMCPGWVRTSIGGKNAPLSVQEGADTAVWLALRKENSTGRFYRARREIPW